MAEPVERSDLPEGQQSKGSSCCTECDDFQARVRAQTAEDIAQAIEARRAGPGWGIWAQCLNVAASVAREHAGKPAESVVAALPDVVGTPDRQEDTNG